MLTKIQLLLAAKKYGVHIIHFEPGKVTATLQHWRKNEAVFQALLTELNADPAIQMIHFDDKSDMIIIEYDETTDPIAHWLPLFEKYDLHK